MRVLGYGPHALLVECGDADLRRGRQRAIEAARLPQVSELVCGERTILVVLANGASPAEVATSITALDPSDPGPDRADHQDPPIDVPVSYDGADLSEAADMLGTTAPELIAWHSGQLWRCEFVGFMPGFGYLTPLGEQRRLPRRRSPRTKVPAGSVGLADHFSGVYPRISPGGWQLIGRTNAQLWDSVSPHPPLITSDALIRFCPVDQLAETDTGPVIRPALGEPVFEVVTTGPMAMIEDTGRPGYRSWGVSRGGAADVDSLRLANRLVGNAEDAAAVEVLVGGLSVRALCSAEVSVTGALGPVLVNGRVHDPLAVVRLAAGQELTVGPAEIGLRRYLGVAGGFLDTPELGSRGSSPTLGLGPPPLQVGQVLTRGAPGGSPVGADLAVTQAISAADRVLRIWPGPRRDWFSDSAWDLLVRGSWTVSSDSDRVGTRLTGAQLERLRSDELPSEPLLAGAIQVPPSGEPVIFGVDHPTTGGYPVIAVVDQADLSALGQCRPGAVVRFQVARPGR